ncbi:phosphoribosyl-AMP cyclohydrolase [Marinagarivorans cellulosilyticus]|uniref:Phosphoribosyl-AMP cyclohydrolase n=1 Tax=Marinagarivorans cellulosilyticus TaxID=2721545 RepID=A0AAN1WH86_9GAMM|nr:phosphoribosyl-AMP cyclohydrolase [Marinagarivorans cellulosilyticus]BCD97558.1 phosphoribosyl-AMP cyclohydrolase [Marinagarivorans cellulosilyticus]
MNNAPKASFLDDVKWTPDGLVPAIAQDAKTGRILMMAWMNRDALAETARTGYAVYWSRSRQALWRKGESSGHQQKVFEIRLDCDADVVTLQIEQCGGIACHTGRESCFYRVLDGEQWQTKDPVLKDPKEIYS